MLHQGWLDEQRGGNGIGLEEGAENLLESRADVAVAVGESEDEEKEGGGGCGVRGGKLEEGEGGERRGRKKQRGGNKRME